MIMKIYVHMERTEEKNSKRKGRVKLIFNLALAFINRLCLGVVFQHFFCFMFSELCGFVV